jgi:biopolymer transport protein ExbD
MGFNRKSRLEDPEINFIPLIDVLLVIIIFLIVSTTFSKFSELKISLPTADANPVEEKLLPINVTVTKEGQYAINEEILSQKSIDSIEKRLIQIAGNAKDLPVIINADAETPHQSVVNIMEASRRAGLTKITFSTKLN